MVTGSERAIALYKKCVSHETGKGMMTSSAPVVPPVRWYGGKCPIASDVMIRAHLRYGPPQVGLAGEFRWSHDLYNAFGAEDIVAYEILENPAAA